MGDIKTVFCAECRCEVFLRAEHVTTLREKRRTFYCPAGHANWFPGKTDSQLLREQLEASQRRTTEERERAERAERALKRAKAAAKRAAR